MQPTLFTATYTAGRAAERPRPAARLRSPRRKLAALVAIAVASAVLPAATQASGNGSGSAGAAQQLRPPGMLIVGPGHLGWQKRCPNTGWAWR